MLKINDCKVLTQWHKRVRRGENYLLFLRLPPNLFFFLKNITCSLYFVFHAKMWANKLIDFFIPCDLVVLVCNTASKAQISHTFLFVSSEISIKN